MAQGQSRAVGWWWLREGKGGDCRGERLKEAEEYDITWGAVTGRR